MNQNYDVCIIGAGAAGLAAANTLDPALSVCIIDKNGIPGRKILATGGGRCNLTNLACRRSDMTLDFFRGLGLETRSDEEGRCYPYSMVSADVVTALTVGLDGRDIDWKFDRRVIGVEARSGSDGETFRIRYTPSDSDADAKKEERCSEIYSDSLIICSGGKAAPAMGTTGDGYSLAKALGHSITRIYPILTGINVDIPDEVAGIRARGEVSLLEDGSEIISEKGEIQFTAEGISGICVFNLTPYIKLRPGERPEEGLGRFSVKMDLAPDISEEELDSRDDSFGIVTAALARWIRPKDLKNKLLPLRGVWGWDRAQCTAGGVPMSEIDEETMASRICPGLYFAGEIMDVQGPCGGFNLQHAWESGINAAKAVNACRGARL